MFIVQPAFYIELHTHCQVYKIFDREGTIYAQGHAGDIGMQHLSAHLSNLIVVPWHLGEDRFWNSSVHLVFIVDAQ